MTQKTPSIRTSRFSLSSLLEFNPQLFREVKGRCTKRNIFITSAISILVQLFVVMVQLGQLPDMNKDISQWSKYCLGVAKYKYSPINRVCTLDLHNNWVINWQLFHFDLFVIFSLMTTISLIIIGTYMLTADVVKEESRGTLNFIRLAPQSHSSILIGKILGVPILLYLAIALLLPINLITGLKAEINFNLLLAYCGVTIASAIFCYSLGLLFSLMKSGLAGFKPWLISGGVSLFLFVTTLMIFESRPVSNTPGDWLLIFNPNIVLPYLGASTFIPQKFIDFIDVKELSTLLFYGQPLWTKASLGIGFIFLNSCIWTYWIWQGLQRRFHNSTNTVLSKAQSYLFTISFVAIGLGFSLQGDRGDRIATNLSMLQLFLAVMFLGLIAALSPHRQTLYDWARYRHQIKKEGKVLWKELVFGEKSPSSLAIAINLFLATIYIIPTFFFYGLSRNVEMAFWGLILTVGMVLFYALVAQTILLTKHRKRSIVAAVVILSMIVVPPMCLGIAGINPHQIATPWLFTFIPFVGTEYAEFSSIMFAILGQWLAISLVSLQLTKQLRIAGASETKQLQQETV